MTFWDVILSIFWFMILFAWIWLLISIFADIFRDHELSGWGKALWAPSSSSSRGWARWSISSPADGR